METATPSRRERLRAETAQEIKGIALRLMAESGPDAISLRAIAREMGMTAGAIYGYYRTRDDLITTLIRELYTELVEALFTARDAAGGPGARILAWAEAFRVWAVANPQGFRLIYGDPVPGYQPPPGGPAAEAEHRACSGLTALIGDAWPLISGGRSADADHQWHDFDEGLVAEFQASYPGLPPAAVALSLRMWGRMHGLVALEMYGHLGSQTSDPAKLYRAEMLDLIASLGLG
ncbi:TetR/AcrR family transcriptional regulator [Amycolatopsis albispora]|uniref:TetR family transcriptional regulator n=1 Tax=Amycolatopsis albispora TaxID=1804986 RepID=A0A344L8J2_9PSEU|nr:TetR/AcrR family transcriptional regulator [Amycolatopsis albispora]AXB44366.1 TetR family transcriptional regulator [Amycolatopsis albispora]